MSGGGFHLGGERWRCARLFLLLLVVASAAGGCRLFRRGGRDRAQEPEEEAPAAAVLAVEPAVGGAIVFYKEDFNFVVIEFEPGPMPRVGQDLDVRRDDRVVGRVRANGPFKGRRGVADVIEGLVATGDSVRARSQTAESPR